MSLKKNNTPSSKRTNKKLNIERGFISKLLETKDITLVKDLQITDHFLTGDSKKIFKFINEFYLSNGQIPTQRIINRKFSDYEFETHLDLNGNEVIGSDEELRFWCNELRNRKTHNTLVDTVEKMAGFLEDKEAQKAYELMKKSVLYIESEVAETTSIDIKKNTEERKLLYKKRKESKGMIGIPTGIDKLDYYTKGLQDGTLTTLIASTGVGKTWLLVLIACNVVIQGYKVLLGTTEMSEDQMRDRIEAMLVGITLGDFDYNAFKAGALIPEQEAKYFKLLDTIIPKLMESIIIEEATGVLATSAKIDQYDPDLIMIDSAYLMSDDEGSDQDWLRIAHITRGIKILIKQKKKPCLINSQADSNTSVKKGPGLGNIGFSKAIGQDSDNVWALFRDEYMIEDDEMELRLLKQREGTLGKIRLNWDFKHMNFSSIDSYIHDKEGEELVEGQLVNVDEE